MIRRLATGGVLACLIAAMAATVPADAATKALFKGRTGQKRVVKLRAGRQALQIVRFEIRLSCRDGSTLIDEESGFVRTPVHPNGRFSDVQVGSTDTVLIRGRAKRGAIHGRLRVQDRLRRGIKCDSHWVRFSARP
jgi:hypothetical protein